MRNIVFLFLIMLAIFVTGAAPSAVAATQSVVKKKVERVQSRFPAWVKSGGDPKRIELLSKQLDIPMKAGRFGEAEVILDQILAILDEKPAASASSTKPLQEGSLGSASSRLPAISAERTVKLGRVPDSARIIFSRRNLVYVMDADGGHETQITYNSNRHLEHVAMSPDRRYIAINYFANPREGGESSRMTIFDLKHGTERDLAPGFRMAGNGGIDFDAQGFVYFTGVDQLPYPNPGKREEFMANYAAHDVWKVRVDGTGLTRLTATKDRGEGDVSVSEDGTMIAYMDLYIDPPNDFTEIWVRKTNGRQPQLVYKGGKARESSVHDPELSPDNKRVIFTKVNPKFKNFPNDPNANTAHDIISVRVDGSDEKILTVPGPISVIPDWIGNQILYLQLTDQESPAFHGIVVMNADGTQPQRVKADANIAKWIPDPRL